VKGKPIYFVRKVIPIFVIVLIASSLFAQERKLLIKQIEIKGSRRNDTQTLLSKLTVQVGDAFSPEAVNTDIKNLYALGDFNQIDVTTDSFEGGIALVFLLHEKPVLNDILFEGNSAIATEQLQEKLTLKRHAVANQVTIQDDTKTLLALYEKEGYLMATITPILNPLSEEKSVLTFLIQEGKQAFIRKVHTDGASKQYERKIKKKLSTKAYFWLTSFFSGSGYYQEEVADADSDRIRDFYLNRGFLQIQVGKPTRTYSEDKTSIDVTFPIVEGDLFTFNQIQYTGQSQFDSEALARVTESHSEKLFRKEAVTGTIQKIIDLYGASGYLFARVVPEVVPHPETKTVDILYRIAEGVPYRIRRINITGNDKTRDYVIRRELRQQEGEIVNTPLLKRSFQRIHNLNFFETIDIVPEKQSEGEVDLSVQVVEKSTGTFQVGIGGSKTEGAVGNLELNQDNLFGRGQLLRARAESGSRRSTYSLTLREPYLFDSTFSGQISLFDQVREFDRFSSATGYSEKRSGSDLTFGKALDEHRHISIGYTLENLHLFDLGKNAPPLVQTQAAFGQTLTSALSFSISRDTRDFIFDPKEGTRHALSVQYAGTFLGGDNDYYSMTADSSRFFSIRSGQVFSIHGRFGLGEGIGEKLLPVGERFFVGGINTVRGFDFGRAGPLAQDGAILGGNKQLFFNVEYLIPIEKEAGLKWVFFYDIGSAFDDTQSVRFSDLREGAGMGLRWISPLGPIRFEWGWNLDPRENEPDHNFDFSIGTVF
jgi:outer membrane protein insertion porin family